MEFEWDKDKAAGNIRKHKISFDEAATVFSDSLSSTFADPVVKEMPMKKKSKPARPGELRKDYDPALIRAGVRGKYAERYRAGTNLILLAPDVAQAFPDAKAVNDALRLLMDVAKASVPGA